MTAWSPQAARPPAVLRAGLEWAAASSVRTGEAESGDRHAVLEFPGGVLLAVLDALGHGKEAAATARRAVTVLEQHAQAPVTEIVQRCHQSLAGTRGVALSLASVDAGAGLLTWLGVGNVEGLLVRPVSGGAPHEDTLLLRGGVVGYQLPFLQAATLEVRPGDVLALATDGIRSGFGFRLASGAPADWLAARVLGEYAKDNDDALVVVARFLGAEP